MLGTVAEKRASLASSKEKWSRVDMQAIPSARVNGKAGNHKQDGVQQWLLSSCQEQVKSESHLDATEPLKRGTSREDDLVLGVEASLYGKSPELKTLRQPLWSKQVGPPLSRWNSQTSASSAHSTLSVMDVLNLWHDDPEELLLELGFGSEEPDISVRIPARFINHQSQARGINIQLFLEAQKNRMDLENPDVSNRFRQLEVLHQVTSAFSALVPGPPPAPAPGSSADLSDASRDRRRRLGQLFRRASKKTLSTTQSQPPPPGNPSANREPDPHDIRPARKHSHPAPLESAHLTPLAEEQSPHACEPPAGEPPRPRLGRDPPCVPPRSPLRRKSPGGTKTPESFEIEEIHSFDEGSAGRGAAELGEASEAKFMRTNSCQSDSSGFLEEPVIPSLSIQTSPVPELMKALHNLSGDSTDSQTTVKESADIPCGVDSQNTVKESADIPYGVDSQNTVKESADIPYGVDSQNTVKESADIPYGVDSQNTVKESADIPYGVDSQNTVKESADIPYGVDSQNTVKESADIPYGVDSQNTVKESADTPYGVDSQNTVKESADTPYGVDSQNTVKESADIPYDVDSQMTVKESADIPSYMESYMTVKDYADIPYGSSTVKESADIPYNMESHMPVKEYADIPSGMDSQITVKESTDIPYDTGTVKESADIPYNTNSLIDVKDSTDIPYGMDSQITVNENVYIPFCTRSQITANGLIITDFPCNMNSPITVKEYADISYNPGSLVNVKQYPDIPYTYRLITVEECADISYNTNSLIDVKDSADISYNTNSLIDVKDSVDISYNTNSLIDVKDSADISYNTNSLIDVKDSADISYDTNSLIDVKDSADILYKVDSQSTVNKCADIPYYPSSLIPVEEYADIPCSANNHVGVNENSDLPDNADSQENMGNILYITKSGIPLMENLEFPHVMDSRDSLKENSDVPYRTGLPCSSSYGHQGAAYSPQAAGLECDRTTGEEEISLNPLAQTGTGFVPGQTFDESEDPSAARTSFGEMETGSGADESAGLGEPVALLCSRCRGSLRTQGGSVARRAESERGRGWSEEGGGDSFRPDWASFGSSKSVSVQMPSSLPSVSQTTRRRCPAPPLDLRREMADAPAAGSHGRGQKLSQGRSQKRSASLDTGLAREEEEEGEGEEEVGRWEAGAHCCCACEHRCPSCAWYSHRPAGELNGAALQLLHKTASCSSPFTFSLDELEGMMRCVRRFRCVLEETGWRLQEEESQVYSHLSDLDREDVASIRQLRAAVRKEAELLETQLAELANHCDTGITTKMQRLLDEQSELCLQLRSPSEPLHWGPVHSHRAPPWGPVSPRPSVGTQCCLLPDLLVSGPSATAALPETQCTTPPPGGTVTLEHDGAQHTPPDKQDLLAFLGFFQSLKDSLRHSVNSDGVE